MMANKNGVFSNKKIKLVNRIITGTHWLNN